MYRVHKGWVIAAFKMVGDPAKFNRVVVECAVIQIGKYRLTFDVSGLLAAKELIGASDVTKEVRTFQGDKLVGALMYRLANPTQVLRVFPVSRGTYVEDHRQIVNEDRIYALIARCELQQPTPAEMDEILQELWDGTDPANWTDMDEAASGDAQGDDDPVDRR